MSHKQPTTLKGSQSIKAIRAKRVFTDDETKIIGRWIEEVTGELLDVNDLLLSLRSGVKLCKLINKLHPGVVEESKVSQESSAPAFSENLLLYLGACFQLSIRTHELFTVDDVIQNGDLQAVLRNIVAVHKACVARGYSGPKLKISDQDENELERVWAELGSLRKALQDCIEENNDLRHDNKAIKEHVSRQDAEISKLKSKVQTLEKSQGDAPRVAKADAENAEGGEGVTSDPEPQVVYIIHKKKKGLGRENSKMRSSKIYKSSGSIYDDGERESSAVIELEQSGEIPSNPVSPRTEATLDLVSGKKVAKKKSTRKGALGNAKNEPSIYTSLAGIAF